ncbi:unnamed protein product [Phytophthora fragariaefolia]|uniref:Unnamed protein product n=1 Tax=Phytophthora fragariaefolia TaxID=1490495 RepID=A0A9W6U9B6_9STRA|nr:unnamed protein product [Phytophthora fragariaefolia]
MWCRGLKRRMCHRRVKDIHELEDIINAILNSEERSSTRENGRGRSHDCGERRTETARVGYRRDLHDRHGRGYDRRMDDSRHTPRASLAKASLSVMMAELQARGSKYGRSGRSKSRDVRRSFEDSSSEDVEGRSTDDDQSGSDYAYPFHSDEHDHHVAAANDSERRTEAIGTYDRSENCGRRGYFPNRILDRSPRHQGQDRREIDERKYDEWNDDSSEGLVSSIARKTGHDYKPENEIKLLSGERLGWMSAQKFDKRVRMRTLIQGAVNDAGTRILLSANAATSDQRNARVVGSEDERIDTKGCRVSARSSTASTSDEDLRPPSHVPGASTPIAVGPQRRPTEDGRVRATRFGQQRWLAAQPSAVELVAYTTPTKILKRPSDSSEGSEFDGDGRTVSVTATTEPLTEWGCYDTLNVSEHPGNDIEFEDYARELAFLPDLTEAAYTMLDYTGAHVRHPPMSVERQDRVVKVLMSHRRIMISSGNALPPPPYGMMCDIDVQGHPPIKQKARRIPLRHLKQLYELLKGLLNADVMLGHARVLYKCTNVQRHTPSTAPTESR